MIKVFYPYWQGGSIGDELRYSLRSLEKHLKEPFEVTVVGDLPGWLQGVTHLPYSRNHNKTSLWNTLRMMKKFLATFKNEDAFFIRMYDDVYLLRDITLDDLKVTRIIRTEDEVDSIVTGGDVWREQLGNTISVLRKMGYPGYMTESHCPELFSAIGMRAVYISFELERKELLTSTLYYNSIPFPTLLIDKKAQRALFYNEENAYSYLSENVAEKCADKYYLNHNDAGLNDELRHFIKERFPEKSRFEK